MSTLDFILKCSRKRMRRTPLFPVLNTDRKNCNEQLIKIHTFKSKIWLIKIKLSVLLFES